MVQNGSIMSAPSHDLVAFGATSFVGKILCRYLWDEFGAQDEMKWAAAGRSKAKLEELRSSFGANTGTLPLVIADAADEASLGELCASTRVVVSTVGPYALYGEPLIKACAESGTDYCDLSGEVQWIRRMVQRYEAIARKSGARIVHCCGFDSIPSDLGVHFLQRQAMKRLGAPCTRVKMRVKAMRGEFSGGTVASLMNVVKEAAADPALRKELADPYSLCPPGSAPKVRQPDVRWAEFDSDFGSWVAPFVMSGINTRIVQRTNALSGQAYGADFTYDEAMLMGRGLKGRFAATALLPASPASCLRVPSSRRARHSSVSCYLSPARGRASRRSARAFSIFASSVPRRTAARYAPRSRATATQVTARPAKCSARPPRASRSTSTRPPRPAASGHPPRSSAIA